MQEIYDPSEDSYLMSETLKKEIPGLLRYNKEIKFLEVGCGSGINLKAALDSGVKKENILGTDINPFAIRNCQRMGFRCIRSDLFKSINDSFDVIAFNPPYLPLDKMEPKKSRTETTGGRKGNEVTIRFLKQANGYLNKEGRIFIITSSLSEKLDFKSLGYEAKEISSKKLFFEKLSLWECLKN